MSTRHPPVGFAGGIPSGTWRSLLAIGARWRSRLAVTAKPDEEPPLVDVSHTLELRRDYREMVIDYCARHGVDPALMQVKALSLGYRQGKEVYVVLVTVTSDAFEAAVHLAHLAPNIEKKVAGVVGSTWLGDYSQFGGVWLHWPDQIRVPDEVRTAMHIAQRRAQGPAASTPQALAALAD